MSFFRLWGLVRRDDSSTLAVCLDLNAHAWSARDADSSAGGASSSRMSLPDFLDHLCVFLNAFLMGNQRNEVAIFVAHATGASLVFPKSNKKKDENVVGSTLQVEGVTGKLRQTLLEVIFKEFEKASKATVNLASSMSGSGSGSSGMSDGGGGGGGGGSSGSTSSSGAVMPPRVNLSGSFMSGALSGALCLLNRHKKSGFKRHARVLICSVAEDSSSQYIAFMNGIFSAQKLAIPVDTCVLSETHSLFLKQASHLTSGIYCKPHDQENLAQYLVSLFVADGEARKYLVLPIQNEVDYRATCFCHLKVIDVGFVCSVCLSVFCRSFPICSTCGTKFPVPPGSFTRSSGATSLASPSSSSSSLLLPPPPPVSDGPEAMTVESPTTTTTSTTPQG